MGKYTQEFKEQAVQLVLTGEGSLAQIARDLGVDKGTLRGWKRAYMREHGEPARAARAGETPEAELARVRRDLRRVQLERDILKKALGIFSQASREDTSS